MLVFLDILLTLTHLAVIIFNLFAWAVPSLRKAHFIGILLTAASWFILGIWFGIGYCPITDWQWQVKEKLGERNLPVSFIKYYADKLTSLHLPSFIIDLITGIAFLVAAIISIYFNFIKKTIKNKQQ